MIWRMASPPDILSQSESLGRYETIGYFSEVSGLMGSRFLWWCLLLRLCLCRIPMFLFDFSVDNERYAEKEGQYDDENDRLHNDQRRRRQLLRSFSKRICKVDDRSVSLVARSDCRVFFVLESRKVTYLGTVRKQRQWAPISFIAVSFVVFFRLRVGACDR